MTPLRIRARLRSALTILRGVSPDEAAEVRAVFRELYDCADDEPLPDLMRIVTDELRYQRDRVNDLNEQYGELERERDEAVALISTLRAEFEAYKSDAASEAKEADRLRAALADVTRDRDALIAKVARLTGEKASKRKQTKEERAANDRDRLATWWSMPSATALRGVMLQLGPATSREIATAMWPGGAPDPVDITNDMRLVSDLARAGYLTVAKGPGGVRVYGLKETPE